MSISDKKYIDDKFREIVTDLVKNVIEPFKTNLETIEMMMEKVQELSIRMEKFEGGNVSGTFPSDLPDIESIMNDSLNIMNTPFAESMRFVVMMSSMIENKKYDNDTILKKIINDYGERMGKVFLSALNHVIQQTQKKKMKEACAELYEMINKK